MRNRCPIDLDSGDAAHAVFFQARKSRSDCSYSFIDVSLQQTATACASALRVLYIVYAAPAR